MAGVSIEYYSKLERGGLAGPADGHRRRGAPERGEVGAQVAHLLLSEVVAAFYEKYDDMPAQRLSLVLRLNHRKFPSALVAHILPLLQGPRALASRLTFRRLALVTPA